MVLTSDGMVAAQPPTYDSGVCYRAIRLKRSAYRIVSFAGLDKDDQPKIYVTP